MSKKYFFLFFIMIFAQFSFGQPLDLFEHKINTERYSLCELLTRFVPASRDFKYKEVGFDIFSVSFREAQHILLGGWAFTTKKDTLNQISYISTSSVDAESYNRYYNKADSMIKVLTLMYGKPLKSLLKPKTPFVKKERYHNEVMLKAMWVINGDKLKVEFHLASGHDDSNYRYAVDKFNDYVGNMKLPAHWDGF